MQIYIIFLIAMNYIYGEIHILHIISKDKKAISYWQCYNFYFWTLLIKGILLMKDIFLTITMVTTIK